MAQRFPRDAQPRPGCVVFDLFRTWRLDSGSYEDIAEVGLSRDWVLISLLLPGGVVHSGICSTPDHANIEDFNKLLSYGPFHLTAVGKSLFRRGSREAHGTAQAC